MKDRGTSGTRNQGSTPNRVIPRSLDPLIPFLAPLVGLAFCSLPGCVAGSLASSTGPRPEGYAWSTAGTQMVHVGETVKFDFVLHDWAARRVQPLGIADYCVVHVGDERIEASPDLDGHFRFNYTFDRVAPGDKIPVTAAPYLTRGARDYMRVRGAWIRGDSPYDQPDRAVAFADRIQLVAYQALVELTLPRPADDLDAETGVLKIRRRDGPTKSIFVERPGRPGFQVSGPEPLGVYRVVYQPAGNDLNPTGTTDVEFKIFDVARRQHFATVTIETP